MELIEKPRLEAPPAFTIRYATTDDDVIAVHQFLMVVSGPVVKTLSGGDIDPIKSIHEVFRLAAQEVVIMAIVDGKLIGTLGLMRSTWWFNNRDFMTDRFHFVLPGFEHSTASAALLDEARKIASFAGLKFIHQGKAREGRRGVIQMMPRVYSPEAEKSFSDKIH